MANRNSNLHTAKREKNDEFYTQYADIESELKHYTPQFEGDNTSNGTIICLQHSAKG